MVDVAGPVGVIVLGLVLLVLAGNFFATKGTPNVSQGAPESDPNPENTARCITCTAQIAWFNRQNFLAKMLLSAWRAWMAIWCSLGGCRSR